MSRAPPSKAPVLPAYLLRAGERYACAACAFTAWKVVTDVEGQLPMLVELQVPRGAMVHLPRPLWGPAALAPLDGPAGRRSSYPVQMDSTYRSGAAVATRFEPSDATGPRVARSVFHPSFVYRLGVAAMPEEPGFDDRCARPPQTRPTSLTTPASRPDAPEPSRGICWFLEKAQALRYLERVAKHIGRSAQLV